MQKTGQKITHFVKNVKIVEFHDHIWNPHEKCIQISTNMPGIGSLIRKIGLEIKAFCEGKPPFLHGDSISRVLSIKLYEYMVCYQRTYVLCLQTLLQYTVI